MQQLHTTTQTFSLTGILETHQCLVLDQGTRVLALLSNTSEMPQMLAVAQFTVSELHILVPLLEAYPNYCPHEVIYACFNNQQINEELVAQARKKLHAAHLDGSFDQEMRPVRNVLSRTRLKLHVLSVDIVSLLETGYLLRPFSS